MKKPKNNKNISVKIHIPDKVPETVKRRKINQLYDILKTKD